MKIEQTSRYLNWQQSKPEKATISPTWDPSNIDVPWTEVIQTEEVIAGDVWDIYTTPLKDQLAELHASWSIPRESVLHYMSLRPDLSNGLELALAPYTKYTHNYSLLKLTAGHMIAWHFDTYATFVKHNNIPESQADKIKRSAIMLTDWSFGHALQVGGTMLSNWRAGDTFTWPSDTWHGAANFGRDDFIIMQVTYIE